MILPLIWLACTPAEQPENQSAGATDSAADPFVDTAANDDTAGDTARDSGQTDSGETLPPPTYSHGTCPVLTSGLNANFQTGDTTRDLYVALPPEPTGAPLLFVFHGMNADPAGALPAVQLDERATAAGVILIAPSSGHALAEWEIFGPVEDNPDLLLMEDVLACASATWSIDLDRVHSFGQSAGGSWSLYAAMHSSQRLASIVPFSGVVFSAFTPPVDPLPIMLAWGGPTDIASGYDVHEANLELSVKFREAGSFVVECEHDGGHSLPSESTDMVLAMIAAHPKGLSSEPWANGLPDTLPDWCRIPE